MDYCNELIESSDGNNCNDSLARQNTWAEKVRIMPASATARVLSEGRVNQLGDSFSPS